MATAFAVTGVSLVIAMILKMAGTLDGSWVNTAAIVTYLLAATGTQAPAENAGGTGTAYGATVKIAPTGGLASGTGTASDAAASIKIRADRMEYDQPSDQASDGQ